MVVTMVQKIDNGASRTPRADRNSNKQTILAALRSFGPMTQAEIARRTELSRATINNIVQALRDEGTVEYQWKNRREALVCLSSTSGSIITIMVREKSIIASLFDFTAQERLTLTSADLAQATQSPSSPEQALELARRLITQGQSRQSAVAGLAIAVEGPIEKSTGAVAPWGWQRLPNWRGLDIRQHFQRHLRLPVVVDNDANLAALAEWTWGEGRGCEDFLHITASEGIGGGIILNGKIYHGGNGLAGEIGHMVIEADGDLCFCGSRGCLSSFATERAILNALSNTAHPKSSLADVVDSANHGDAACQRVLFETGLHLGKALGTVVRVISPSLIAIGGTLGTARDVVLGGLLSSPEIINLRAIAEPPRFCTASIIEDAALFGGMAAIMAALDLGLTGIAPWMHGAPAVQPA